MYVLVRRNSGSGAPIYCCYAQRGILYSLNCRRTLQMLASPQPSEYRRHAPTPPTGAASGEALKELLLKKGAGAAALTVDGADAEIWLTAYCRSVLAAQVGCVPAAGVLVDLCEKRGSAETLTEGAALCLALATKWDTIRSKYWAMRQAQLSSSAAA
mmetsp:Transcript_25056/g.58989  ORF Transcript_25056/g.58989 Transcript_25056/m.58989 type:complete len:157 (-) Transcript_25056:150-620(-)